MAGNFLVEAAAGPSEEERCATVCVCLPRRYEFEIISRRAVNYNSRVVFDFLLNASRRSRASIQSLARFIAV